MIADRAEPHRGIDGATPPFWFGWSVNGREFSVGVGKGQLRDLIEPKQIIGLRFGFGGVFQNELHVRLAAGKIDVAGKTAMHDDMIDAVRKGKAKGRTKDAQLRKIEAKDPVDRFGDVGLAKPFKRQSGSILRRSEQPDWFPGLKDHLV